MLALACFSEKNKVEDTSYHLHRISLGCWFNKYSFTGEKAAWVIFASRLFLSFETGDKPPSTKNKHWLNMNHINLFLKTAPRPGRRIHRVAELKRMQATHDKAVVWLSVAPHTVSGAHFHTICMIRLIGLVWKHVRGTVAEFLLPRQLEMRIEIWRNITGSDSLPARVSKGWLNGSQRVLVSSEAAWLEQHEMERYNMKIAVNSGFFGTFTLSVGSVNYSYQSVDVLGSLDPWKHLWASCWRLLVSSKNDK